MQRPPSDPGSGTSPQRAREKLRAGAMCWGAGALWRRFGHHGAPMRTRREAVAPEIRTPVRDRLGVRGGTAPRQPPQGTHGVWPQGVSGTSEAQITAGDRVSSIRTARSATPALGLDPAGPCRESGKNGLNGGNPEGTKRHPPAHSVDPYRPRFAMIAANLVGRHGGSSPREQSLELAGAVSC